MVAMLLALFLGGICSRYAFAQEAKSAGAAWAEKNLDELLAVYHHFHRNPELSFQEKETAATLAKHLKSAGAEVTENIGGFGVVGLLKNGPGKTIMVRTDLDDMILRSILVPADDLNVDAISGDIQISTSEPLLEQVDARVDTITVGYPDSAATED